MVTSRFNLFGVPAAMLAATILSLSFGSSCSGLVSDDVFYVYVVNGYAGGGDLTVYSSTGPIAQDLAFGEVSNKIALDRTRFSGELQLSMDGMSDLASLSLDTFAFYPDETVTLFVKRRSGENTFQLQVMRHNLVTQGSPAQGQNPPAYACTVQFYNGLSLANTYTEERYTLQTQWSFANRAYVTAGIYDPSKESVVPTECGNLNLAELGALGNQYIGLRNAQLTSIDADPWLWLVDDPDGAYLTWRWGRWDGQTGTTIQGIRSSAEYIECLSQAVTIEQPTGAMGLPTGESSCEVQADGSVTIPRNDQGFPAVIIDQEAVTECLKPQGYSGRALQPNSEEAVTIYYNQIAGAPDCSFTFRYRTRAVDSIFDAPPDQMSRQGPYVAVNVRYPLYTWQHIMLYGRPVQPLTYQITSAAQAEDYVDIIDYPGTNKDGVQGTRTQNEGGQSTAAQ